MGKDQELLEAARNGNIPVVEKILGQKAKRSGPLASLRRGPGANVQDSSGYTSLHHAALNGHKEIVRLLLAHEASTNIVDTKGSSPLHLASWAGNVDIVRLILSHGPLEPDVNLTTKDNETALHCAAQYGHAAVVALLLEHGCDPTIRNCREETALDLAAQYGRLETVELLVRTHPELTEPMRRAVPGIVFPHTPLHLASRNGHKAVVEELLAAGFNVNLRTPAGTPLHEAALCGKVEVVRTLLERGVDLNAHDANHNTVLDLLGQFPPHVTQDIMTLIKRHGGVGGTQLDSDADSLNQSLPPIPVPPDPALGSPYENVRPVSRGRAASPGWELYRQSRSVDDVIDEQHRRRSGTSAMSLSSDTSMYQTPPAPKSFMDSNFHHSSDDYPSMYRHRDSDQLSISSTTSSTGGPSPRDREQQRQRAETVSGIYLPMTPRSAHSPGSNNKVSPTPPKKPPRRNLSVSPTHLTPMSVSVDGSYNIVNNQAYEYIFLARSGVRSHGDLEELGMSTRLQHGRSVDTYVEMNKPFSIPPPELHRGRSEEFMLDERNDRNSLSHSANHQAVAITTMYENVPIKTQNPRRKLRRHFDVYENHELKPRSPTSTPSSVENNRVSTFISNAYITLKSSEESLLDDRRSTNDDSKMKKGQNHQVPLSPTHYNQPPTPDHPPPTPMQAEKSIHDRIRPLSQEYKRRSRDIETETDEDFLIFPALDESSGSLSSSISLSDRSISTDNNVEEYVCDIPFAGLFRGSTTALDGLGGPRPMPAERPKTLRRLKHVYDNANNINGTDANKTTTNHDESPNDAGHKRKSSSSSTSSGNDRDKSLSLLSPFDEQEEWAKISEIMASFGTGLVRESVFVTELEQEFQARLGLSCSQSSLSAAASSTPVGQWLSSLGFVEYEQLFISSGYDDLDFINGVIDENELKDMGISNESDRTAILEAVKSLPLKIKEQHQHYNNNVDESIDTVDEWLRRIHLEKYAETFSKHLYSEMDRIRRIWEVELMAVLEIQKSGHRKRILMSVMGNSEGGFGPNFDDINSDLNALKNNIQQLKNEIKEVPAPVIPALTVIPSPHTAPTSTPGTETLRRNHKKNRPAPQPPTAAIKPADLEIRSPSELLFGVPATLQTQWRHPPVALVTGSVTYIANYLGSTVVKELRGTESTKKSIQKLKKSTSKDQRSTPDIVLSISYRGVKFLNTLTQELICEHEIRNINCACQDSDDMTHFAYITKDHTTNNHFCHVFYVPTMDQATAIILTLGQAFEVAYQMALREQVTNKGHTRSQSANQITGGSPGRAKISLATNNGVAHPATNHGRSHSINEIKLNGHQLSLAPMLTTEDVHKSGSNSPRTPTGKAPIAIKDEM